MKSFAELFKKYRLRAEFETVSAFSDALSEKGYHYEDSIFSHWQKGTRIPTNRHLVLTIIEIFIERDAICSLDEANQLLESVKMGYVTEKERKSLPLSKQNNSPFQVPNEVSYFTGRAEIIRRIEKSLPQKKVFLLYGPPGIGKTALAIKLGHVLRDRFSDGVLWYKVDSSNVMDILLSIAHLYGEDISEIKDIEVRASIVRTLLSQRKVLLIFDNVRSNDKLSLLLPNSPSCCVIFTSQDSSFLSSSQYTSISLGVFKQDDTLLLFTNVFNAAFVKKNRDIILQISKQLDNLPLAIHLIALQVKQNGLSLEEYSSQLDESPVDLQMLQYEDKNLFRAISMGFNTLDHQTKKIFISLGVFDGKDFSLGAVAFINKISLAKTEKSIKALYAISLVEHSQKNRYRMHRLVKIFARQKMENTSYYLRAAQYYEELLLVAQQKKSYTDLQLEVDNIIYIFKKCYEYGYWDEIIVLWNPIEKFLIDINEVKKLSQLAKTIDTSPRVNNLQKFLTGYMVVLIIYWLVLFFSGAKTSFWNYFFSFIYTFIALIGGFVGIARSRKWGMFSSHIGKAIFFISAGIFSWGIGNLIWAYYNFYVHIEIPYPSYADFGFISASVLWIIGIVYLSRATGARFSRKKRNKFLWAIPFVVFSFSCYLLFFVIKRSFSDAYLKVFFDFAYPTVDMIILTSASIIFGLSVNFFGGKYRRSLYVILAGFMGMYIADSLFSYTTSMGTYYNGSVTELIFNVSIFFLSWGTLSFYLTPKKIGF